MIRHTTNPPSPNAMNDTTVAVCDDCNKVCISSRQYGGHNNWNDAAANLTAIGLGYKEIDRKQVARDDLGRKRPITLRVLLCPACQSPAETKEHVPDEVIEDVKAISRGEPVMVCSMEDGLAVMRGEKKLEDITFRPMVLPK